MQVLIVDDDIATVDVIQKSIDWEKLGIAGTFTAYNISLAKTILLEQSIDIVISDIEMPQGSGIDLLEWFREQKLSGEFLLLTCHESFDYATDAIKYQASEYLLKPFNVNVMEVALKKIILKRKEEQQLQKNSEYGKWVKENQRQLQISFWSQLLSGHIAGKEEVIASEIEKRKLEIEREVSYCLIVSKITGIKEDREKMSPDLMLFVVENIHSEIFCGNPDNHSVVSMDYDDYYLVATVSSVKNREELSRCCEELRKDFKKMFSSEITICIGRPCKIYEIYQTFHEEQNLIERNVAYYGSYFHEEDSTGTEEGVRSVFAFDKLEQYFTEKKKMEILSYLKEMLNDRAFDKTLNNEVLKRGKEEILQVVYTYLGKKGIQATGLLADENLIQLGEKAFQSVIDMIRWTNYLIDCTYNYEESVQKSYSLSEKIDQYIKEHYKENIGRTEIAEQFYLAPEYLSKAYKKQTGKNIKDTIAECRIEEAKRMLERGERVSDVAEAVGFDNFTYFSTMFKKYTGLSPNQYRKK